MGGEDNWICIFEAVWGCMMTICKKHGSSRAVFFIQSSDRTVSLRLGHSSGLTVHRTVIQYLGVASLLAAAQAALKN